jgi:hypothetical protein
MTLTERAVIPSAVKVVLVLALSLVKLVLKEQLLKQLSNTKPALEE